MKQRNYLIIGALLCALCVVLGAFGAHALKDMITAEHLMMFDKAVRYQFIHALSLILFSIMPDKYQTQRLRMASGLLLVGITFFSGSLYILSTREASGITSTTFLGPITPLGGICLISGWLLFAYNIIKTK